MSRSRKRKKSAAILMRKIQGTSERPRLSVYRSNRVMYAQIIDDIKGITLTSAASEAKKKISGLNMKTSKNVGKDIGKKALNKGINSIVFDRNGYRYHGNVKALAEGVREEGVKF